MRRLWSLLPCVVAMSTPASALSVEEQLAACRAGPPALRNECFNAIGETQPPNPAGKWRITETTSPVDDSPTVVGILFERDPSGDLALFLRCREGQTEAYFSGSTFLGISRGIAGLYRINRETAVQTTFNSSVNGKAAFLPRPITFMHSLPPDGSLFVRLIAFDGRVSEGSFDLFGIEVVRTKVGNACGPRRSGASRAPAALPFPLAAPIPTERPHDIGGSNVNPVTEEFRDFNSLPPNARTFLESSPPTTEELNKAAAGNGR